MFIYTLLEVTHKKCPFEAVNEFRSAFHSESKLAMEKVLFSSKWMTVWMKLRQMMKCTILIKKIKFPDDIKIALLLTYVTEHKYIKWIIEKHEKLWTVWYCSKFLYG